MRDRYQERMEQIHQELLDMGMYCEQAIQKTCCLLLVQGNRKALTEEIYALERAVDEKERTIESICIQLLLRQQPVATDLRRISAALKMITDLERIGDQATDIAEILRTGSLAVTAGDVKLTEMAEFAMHMVNKSVEAYVQRDLPMAQSVIADDDTLDKLFLAVRGELGRCAQEGGITNDQALDLLMISKYYERIGDHATNIGEWVEFSLTGRHRNGETVNDVFAHLK